MSSLNYDGDDDPQLSIDGDADNNPAIGNCGDENGDLDIEGGVSVLPGKNPAPLIATDKGVVENKLGVGTVKLRAEHSIDTGTVTVPTTASPVVPSTNRDDGDSTSSHGAPPAAASSSTTSPSRVIGLPSVKIYSIGPNGEYQIKQGVVVEEDILHRVLITSAKLEDRIESLEKQLGAYKNQTPA